MQGTTNEVSAQFAPESLEFLVSMMDELGSESDLQPLSYRLGPRDGCTLPMDQAGRVAFWRYAEWAGHQLAEAHQGVFLKRRRGKTHCCEFFEAAGAIAEAQAQYG
jgi:hypothetical protein